MLKRIISLITFLITACFTGIFLADAQVPGSRGGQNPVIKAAMHDSIYHPSFVRQAVYFDATPLLRDMPQLKPVKGQVEREIWNNRNPRYQIWGHHPFLLPEDPVWQKQDGTYLPLVPGPIQNFDGTNNLSGVYPPDTQGDVSNGNYVQIVNTNFAVYSKTGTLLLGPSSLSTIWNGIPAPWNGTNSGDPIVLWDQAAQRWIISQFSLVTGNFAELVAVSQTSDPTGSWYRYVFQFGIFMPDYPKFGIWPDGYYMSVNQFLPQGSNYNWEGVGAAVLDRTKMLTGDPTASMQYIDLGSSSNPWAMLPSDWDGTNTPLTGEPDYYTFYDDWSSSSVQYLRIWSFTTDWNNPSNTTFTESYVLTPQAFNEYICADGNGQCISQPGTSVKLDDLSDRLMYRLQYRNFGSYQVMLTNQCVNVDGNGHAGVRWYELRNSGSGWGIYQQGTYAPDASQRWMGSIAMNGQGDIALGYSVSDATSTYPSIRYTGRRASDPLGQMTVTEQSIIAGSGAQTGSVGRWGDYSMMSVDPTDDLTFWYTTEYIQTTGGAPWRTRIASFKFSNVPAVITTSASGVTTSAATLNGTINPNGLSSTYHFEWGTTTAYGNSSSAVSAGSGTSNVNESIGLSGLTAGTTYHFRLVGVNSDGTTNGNDMSFVPGGAILTTTAATSITTTTASSGGNISTDGGAAVTARGVCWSTSLNPTVAGSHTTDGSGTGIFTSSLSNLSGGTSYHLRAYATNATGTFYGNDMPFSTSCGTYGLPFTEGFNGFSIPFCWSQTDHQGNAQIWQFGVIPTASPSPALDGNYAFLNSNGYGSGSSQNADLVTPTIDLTIYSNVYLKFSHYFQYSSGSSATLSYSTDNGSSWTQIQQWTSTTSNPASFNQVIAGAGGHSQVKFKWNYTGSNGYVWAIDDVTISASGLWIGGAVSNPTDWNTAANWDGSTIPTASTNVTIPVRTSLPVINTTGAVCNSIVFGSGGTLTINPNKDLTVSGSITFNGSNLIILGNSSGSGSLIDNGITGTGSSTVQRYMTGNWIGGNPGATTIWHTISAPVANPSNSLFNGSLMNKWNEVTQNWDPLTLPYENMPVGKGYIVAPTSGGITAAFTGTLNTGNTTINNLTKTGASTWTGFNLIGNPFPSAIQWNTGISVTNVADYAWVWNGSAYILMTRSVGTDVIPAEQGFFVQVTTSPGSVTIPNSNRIHSTHSYYKSGIADLLTLKIEGNGYWDQTQVRILSGSSDTYNADYDGLKLMGSDIAPQLYSFKQDISLSLISLPSLSVYPVIQLGFKPGAAGNFIITASDLETFAPGTNLYLEDILAGRNQDLNASPVYEFNAVTGQPEHRFNLHFAAMGVNDTETNGNIKIYSSENVIYINITSSMSGDIVVYNLLGSEVARATIRGNSLNKISLDVPSGFYLVKVNGNTASANAKVLIR